MTVRLGQCVAWRVGMLTGETGLTAYDEPVALRWGYVVRAAVGGRLLTVCDKHTGRKTMLHADFVVVRMPPMYDHERPEQPQFAGEPARV